MKILLCRPLPPSAIETLERIAPHADIRHETDEESIPQHLSWAEIIYGNPPAPLLFDRPQLRWLQLVTSDFEDYLPRHGEMRIITTGHGLHARAIAQQVVMTMLMFARGHLHFSLCQENSTWDRDLSIPFDLAGQTLGLVGCGLVAHELTPFAALLGLRIIGVKRTPAARPPEFARLDSLAGLDQLLSESDHVVVTLPFTLSTARLIDAGRVRLIKTGAFFYNVACGRVVDEAALLARLQAGELSGAALDVFAHEPLPPNSPWWKAPRTVVSPHIAGNYRTLDHAMFTLFADNLRRFVEGRPLRNIADFERGY